MSVKATGVSERTQGAPNNGSPTVRSVLWLSLRILGLRTLRGITNLTRPIPKLTSRVASSELSKVAGHSSQLRTAGVAAESAFEEGKIQNLRLVAKALDGLWMPAGSTFSFWRQVGRCSRLKGYVDGRQLQEGCLVPAIGGGICQLSNALYDVALQAGFEILERHSHTRVVPGSAAEVGRDATVAWNHIDLRWRATVDSRLQVRLTGTRLEVSLWTGSPAREPAPERKRSVPLPTVSSIGACGACGEVSCHLFAKGVREVEAVQTAVVVDEMWPEFDAYLATLPATEKEIFMPLDGARRNRSAYAWKTDGYSRVHEALFLTLLRSFRSRRLAQQGAARQRAKLAASSELARHFAKRLSPHVRHLVVTQELLPFLWREGALGGRTFDVLMTRLPMAELQARLDEALARHPERQLLGDFRAPNDIISAESDALRAAAHLVTPHRDIARGDRRRILLDWCLPVATSIEAGRVVAFPGPTISRKGAYEVREAMQRLGLTIRPMGRDLETGEFWSGIPLSRPSEDRHWLDGVGVVVQPAILEDRPRRLLEAIACGVPVVATAACGVEGLPGVTLVSAADVDSLVSAIEAALQAGTA